MNTGLVLVLFAYHWSVGHSIDFCDNNSRNMLIGSVFAFNHTIYVLRRPHVFILARDGTGNWRQLGDAIPIRQLLRGYPRSQYNSGFSVSDFVGCGVRQDIACRHNSPDFDATNITFIFFGKEFFVFKRIKQTMFQIVDQRLNNAVPWKANKINSTSIADLFPSEQINEIDGAVYILPETSHLSPTVWFVDRDKAYKFFITDSNPVKDVLKIQKRPVVDRLGGAFVDTNGDKVFIYGNRLFKYVASVGDNDFNLEHINSTAWDYFNCGSMKVNTGSIEQISTEQMSSTDNEVIETIGSTSVAIESTHIRSTATSQPEDRPANPESADNYKEYMNSLKTTLTITLVFIILTMICVTILSFLSFNI